MKGKKVLFALVIISVIVALFFFLKATFEGIIIINPVLLTLGPLQIRWYGVLIAAGIVIAYLIGRSLALKEGIKEDYLIEAVFFGIILGIIGARLYYVVFELDYYLKNPVEIFITWHGGLAIHGGIFGGLLAGFIYTRFRKKANIGFLQAADIFTAVLPLAQAIGRWGNFMNHEAYGRPTDLPWKMFVPFEYRMPGFGEYEFFHPTFLYESLWNVALFIFLISFMKKRKNYGEITGLYMIFYSIARFFIEGLRLDSLYIRGLRTAQLVSVLLLAIGVLIFIVSRYKGKSVKRVS